MGWGSQNVNTKITGGRDSKCQEGRENGRVIKSTVPINKVQNLRSYDMGYLDQIV